VGYLGVKQFNVEECVMPDAVDRILAQWQAERPDLGASPMGIVGRIKRVGRLLEHGLGEYFAEHDLQSWEFDILATLRRSGPPYQLTAGALVASSMITSGAMTNRIDRLSARGLVTRRVDPGNRRSVLIALTDEGRVLIDRAVTGHVANEDRLLAGLSAAQRDQLADLLRTLALHLGDKAPAER
jgi:DNA-binding MarR family transcriptional regulator